MNPISVFLLLVGVVCFVLAGVGENLSDEIQIGWIGLAFFAASFFPYGNITVVRR